MKHLVNTLELAIACGSEEDAFGVQHRLAPLLQQQVAKAVEKSAGAITDPRQLVIIERIEIDLAAINFYTSEQVLADAIEYEVNRQLKPYIQPGTSAEKQTMQQQNTALLFRHFMLTGNLPWWAQSMYPDISSVFIELMETNHDEIVGFLYENHASAVFWQRLVFQLNTGAKKLVAASVKEIKMAAALIKEGGAGVQKTESANTELILEVKLLNDTFSEKELLDMLLLNVPLLYGAVSATSLLPILSAIIQKNSQLPGIESLFAKAQSWRTELATATADDQKPTNVWQVKAIPDGNIVAHDAPPVFATENSTTGQEVEKFFIQHAGIILLAPYLKPFFNQLQLLENGKWKNMAACFKGVHLLRYLACGETGVAEYSLSFEKIICGLSPVIPVPLDAGLEPHELNEAISLLQSVIENWKKLGNTSINGLRESFIKRDGIITPKENNWLLQVERKTVDVLLDSIPWGFSTFSLPWNNSIIFTEW